MAGSSREHENGCGDPILCAVLAWDEQMIPRLARAYPGLGRDLVEAAWSRAVFGWWEKHGHSGELPRPGDLYWNACRIAPHILGRAELLARVVVVGLHGLLR